MSKDKSGGGNSGGEGLRLFTLESLPDLGDGSLRQDFDKILAALVKDCTDRPSIKKSRKLNLSITVTPVLKTDGTCDDVEVDVEVGSKSPAKVVPTYRMTATVHGGLRYSPESPDDPGQRGLGFGG